MKFRFSPAAREHLIRIWQQAGSSPATADSYIADLIEVLQTAGGALPFEPLCADIAEGLLFVRVRNHVIFLRALSPEEMGVVAVLSAGTCASHHLECGHSRCHRRLLRV